MSLLIGEAAMRRTRIRSTAPLTEHGNVCRVIYSCSLYIGPEDILVEVQVAFRRDEPFAEVARTIEAMERHPGTAAERAGGCHEPGINLSEDKYDLPPYQQPDQRD